MVQIKCLKKGAFAKQIYIQTEENCWPGQEIKLNTSGNNLRHQQRQNIKKYIQAAIFEAHYSSLLSQFEASKKLKAIKNCNFRQMEEYFKDKNLVNARIKFKTRQNNHINLKLKLYNPVFFRTNQFISKTNSSKK